MRIEETRGGKGSGSQALRLLSCLCLLLLSAHAVAQERLRVLVFASDEVRERIRGQTRDLPVDLAMGVLAGGQGEPEQDLDVIVRVEGPKTGQLTVRIRDQASQRELQREVPVPARETHASSASAEMVALVVRGELTAIVAGRAAAAAERAAVAPVRSSETRPPAAPPARPPEAAPPLPAPAPARSGFASTPWRASLAYRPSRLIRTRLAHALAAGVRRDVGQFALGASGHLARPVEVDASQAALRLVRGGLRLEGLRTLVLGRLARLDVGLAIGATLQRRRTEQVANPLTATEDELSASGTLGPMAELSVPIAPHVGLLFALGLDAVLWRTKFAYESPTGQRTVASVRRLEPWLSLGFFVRWGSPSQTP